MKINAAVLVQDVITAIPEFEVHVYPEISFSAYLVYGDFGIFIKELLHRQPVDEKVVARCFAFINDLLETGDEKIHQLLRVTTFEILTDEMLLIKQAQQYLTGRALTTFLETLKFIRG